MKLKISQKVAPKSASVSKTKQAKTVAKATKANVTKAGALVSQLYRKLRETALNLCNCRKADFSKQVITEGRLPKATPESVVIVQGEHGTTVSTLPVARGIADLGDGRLFDLTGLKHVQVLPPGKAFDLVKSKGRPVNATIGKDKVTSVGHIMGDMDQMYVVFVNAKRQFRTLETKSLPGGRNKTATFALGK